MIKRKQTRVIHLGSIPIGGNNPITIQSMTTTHTSDIDATVAQARALVQAGCQILRVAVPDEAAAHAIPELVKQISVPLIADIHFDYRLALKSIAGGIHGLRLNPGNIGGMDRVRAVVDAAREHQIPIRIGVNSGSLDPVIQKKYGVTAQAIVESALQHVRILEEANYAEMKISVKASSVPLTIEAYRLLSSKVDYPLHLGVTEAGTSFSGTIKSAVGIGALLAEGIGDTLRVSLTADPVEEVIVAKEILRVLGIRKGLNIISCPTCGRTQINLIGIAREVEKQLIPYAAKDITVAVMGCVVNGPGEAKEADYGICGGDGVGLVFKKGVITKRVPEAQLIDALLDEIKADAD
ncbi:MAG: flavodoxin-dependent (E)-4-hydroxy-3-methylbut-2-enyl-diphosphate synthase [Candidatus Cloacimonetes bacterium]|nr:flavodoxin-dependent (E)-4-hydroxy-3-methylbut-2-enyl-diphosphate synthase [Candidatus Cloacimonadota bacterium]